MTAVAHNTDLLATRLAKLGWKPLWGELHEKPSRREDDAVIQQVEEMTGAALPITLKAFWNHVGGINFIWNYQRGRCPDLGVSVPLIEMDPLCISAARDVEYLLDQWDPEDETFYLELSPDALHKANVSGGDAYNIALPVNDPSNDPLFDWEDKTPFVEYLRLCFTHAGFPGLKQHAQRPDVAAFIAKMTDGMLPF